MALTGTPVRPVADRAIGAESAGPPTWLAPVLAALAVAAAALAFRRVYEPSVLPVPVVVGTALGAAAAAAAWRVPARLRLLALLPGAFLAALLAGLVTVAAAADPRAAVLSGTAFAGVRSSVFGGLSRVLTTTLPAPATPDLLPQVAVFCAVAAALGVSLARRGGLLAYAPGAVVLVLGLVSGVGGAGSVVAVTLPYAAVVAAGSVRRVRSVALPAALALVVVGVALGPAAADAVGRHRYDPRDLTAARVALAQPPDPLALLPGWLLRPGDTAFTAQVDGAWLAQTPDWRLATFDTFDGQDWTAGSPAVSIGYRVAQAPPAGADVSAATTTVSTPTLPGVYVPVAGAVRDVDRAGLAYDLAGASLLDPHGVAGRSYEVTAAVPDYVEQRLADAGVGTDVAAGDLDAPACTPPQLVKAAQLAVGDAQRPVAQAQAIATYLARGGGFADDPTAVSGHSCGRLAQLFTGDHRGTSEQFSSAFVLMARSVGLPSRLAVGFGPGTVTGDRVVVHTGDALAWPEVDLAGVGWVPFDPTPRSGTVDTARQQKAVAAVAAAGAPDPTLGGGDRRAPMRVTTSAPVRPDRGGFPWWGIALVAVAGGLLLGLPALVVARKALRRRRRRREGPLGAWAELLDRLGERGIATATLTTRDVSLLVATAAPAGAEMSRTLADVVDVAVFAPSASADTVAHRGPGSWNALTFVERSLRGATDRRTRVRHRLYPLLGTAPTGSAP